MTDSAPVVLITGAAQRLGARTAETLHRRGWRVVIHYRSRQDQAEALAAKLNAVRDRSAIAIQADLERQDEAERLAQQAVAAWGQLDGLVNNASVFYPTPTTNAGYSDWDRIMNTNLRAPFFLGKACLPALKQARGAIVNLIDIYSEKPLANHPLYCASKAGLASLTRSWAKDLAPEIRVNGVSPGAILWPEGNMEGNVEGNVPVDPGYQQRIVEKTPLGRTGEPDDIAGAIAFLLCDAPFITGQILAVDGGRSLNI